MMVKGSRMVFYFRRVVFSKMRKMASTTKIKQEITTIPKTFEKRLNPCIQEFEKISKRLSFIDHSSLIEIFYEQNTQLFISAPRMFGKSTNMDMIKCFFEIAKDGDVNPNYKERAQYELFKDLNIVTKGSEEDLKKHLGAHPIIFVDLKGCLATNLTETIDFLYERIKAAFTIHEIYLKKSFKKQKKWEEQEEINQNESLNFIEIEDSYIDDCEMWFRSRKYEDITKSKLVNAIPLLCNVLYKAYGNRHVVILIDEVDALIAHALINNFSAEDIKILCNIMTSFLELLSKGQNISKITHAMLFTGVSYISGIGFSEKIKAIPCRFLDDTGERKIIKKHVVPYYGLHEDDLDMLLNKLQGLGILNLSNEAMVKAKKEEINKLYNRYRIKEGQECIYPIYAVISYLIDGSSPDPPMPPVLKTFERAAANRDIGLDIINLIHKSGEIEITPQSQAVNISNIIKLRDCPNYWASRNAYFQLLMEVGFLTHAETPPQNKSDWKLRFANDIMRRKFISTVREEDISISDFTSTRDDICAQHIRNLYDYVFDDEKTNNHNFNKDSDLDSILTSIYNSLKILFRGCRDEIPVIRNERDLQFAMIRVMDAAKRQLGITKVGCEEPMTDNFRKNGYIDIWAVDEQNKFGILMELKWRHDSSRALQEIINPSKTSDKKAHYLHFPDQIGIKRCILIGLSINKNYLPSISVAIREKQQVVTSYIYVSNNGIEKRSI